jgi:hypothetical protein
MPVDGTAAASPLGVVHGALWNGLVEDQRFKCGVLVKEI